MKSTIPIYNKNNGKLRELIVQLLHKKKILINQKI